MAEKDKQDIELNVKEEKDGSAVVDLPNDLDMGDDLDESYTPSETVQEAAEGGSVDDGDEPDHPDDSDAVRAAKRAKRRAKKEMFKQNSRERELQLQQLKRQNDEMARRMAEWRAPDMADRVRPGSVHDKYIRLVSSAHHGCVL